MGRKLDQTKPASRPHTAPRFEITPAFAKALNQFRFSFVSIMSRLIAGLFGSLAETACTVVGSLSWAEIPA